VARTQTSGSEGPDGQWWGLASRRPHFRHIAIGHRTHMDHGPVRVASRTRALASERKATLLYFFALPFFAGGVKTTRRLRMRNTTPMPICGIHMLNGVTALTPGPAVL